jgi:thioesterase domain-containing protein
MTDRPAQTDTALLFRSVRAAKAWLRADPSRAEKPAVPGCVPMKPGADDAAALFMIPGATGSILQLAPIAAAMTGPMPVYALKPRGMAEGELPFERLDEMAAHAIGLMRKTRPHGPYYLLGYSAGGLVALEIARQLAVSQQDVPLVVLLDTYPSRETWPLSCHVEILFRQFFRALWSLRRCTPRQLGSEIARRVRGLFWYLALSGVKLSERRPLVAEGSDAASRRVHIATYNAGEAYRPQSYGEKVVFLQPEFLPNLEPRAPHKVWGKFLSDFSVYRIPGSHLGLLDEGAAATATEIERCLAEVRGQ